MTDDAHKTSPKTEQISVPANGKAGVSANGLDPTEEALADRGNGKLDEAGPGAAAIAPGADAAVSGNGTGSVRKVDTETRTLAKTAAKKADDDPVGKVYDSVLIKRLGHYVKPYWVQAVISSISVMLKSLSDVTGPYLLKVAIDRYLVKEPGSELTWLGRRLPSDPWHGITQLAELYTLTLLLAYGFEFIQTYLMQWLGQKMMFDLRRDIFRHMQRLHVGFFDTHAVGRLVTRLTSDVDAINEMFTAGILAIVDDFVTLTIMAVIMLRTKWWLALLAFSVLPLILIVTRMFRDSVRESYRRVRAAIARINSFTQEHISGMSVVQLFNREERAYQDFEVVNKQHMVAFKDTIFAYALYYPAVDLLSTVAVALVLWWGGWSVLAHTSVTVGMLAMFNMYSLRFWRPIQDLSDKYNILQAAMAACERIFKLMDTKPEIVSPAKPKKGNGSNRIEFRHVWFTYQKLTDEQKAAVQRVVVAARDGATANEELAALKDIDWILKDVSFSVEPGQTVAIVGHTGAGKTTLTSLMMRFYEVTAGQILLDGVDVREHDVQELRQHFAVVLQDPFLFTGTIADNIRLGNAAITDAQMEQAARDVNVLDFVESLPNKFDQPVEERGNSLSTGQKQLINFARALAFNPRILILDEATSSVDTDTELRIRGALERMVEGRTSVLIAHRLSTVQRADSILVMHKGQLREMGSHQQLLAQRGLYWKLYQLQYKDQELGVGSR
ncbi:ABC transporter ATP-binding protein [Occallatibacter riparius]|uniref:ABC transporter ATP-binding protein/permease n=1 Tax=Occallatibacter riparius TaxID=1002689 RepID=A0A9J7BJ68_9BACT|nr:ABC transporter ATP-binding protein [Occallatibacter riparius]UWZ82563.1 ABC transporter ATP-binding protein/permease [Occallatibacter riparius]